jgi:hypothetical protein
MFHIFVHTPLDKNSEYIAHLIEHCMFSGIDSPKKYYEQEDAWGTSYTYYTSYTLKTDSDEELQAFLRKLRSDIPNSIIAYETKVLRDECSSRPYFKRLLDAIGKVKYGPKFAYCSPKKYSYSAVHEYHATWYKQGKMVVIEKDGDPQDIPLKGVNWKESFSLKLGKERETVFVADFTPESLFVSCMFEKLFDDYLDYYHRYQQAKYYWNDTLQGEFEDMVFISVDTKYLPVISSIPQDFIQEFIARQLVMLETSDFSEVD